MVKMMAMRITMIPRTMKTANFDTKPNTDGFGVVVTAGVDVVTLGFKVVF